VKNAVTTLGIVAALLLCGAATSPAAHAQARGREQGNQSPKPEPKKNDDPPARSSGSSSSSGSSQPPARQREEAVQVQTTPSPSSGNGGNYGGGGGGGGPVFVRPAPTWRQRWWPFWDRGGYTVYRIYDCGQPLPETALAAFSGSGPAPSRLVFASDRERGDWELFTVRPDGRDLRRLTRRRGEESHPSFSPDGRFVVFSGRSEEGPLAPGGASQNLWIADAENAVDARPLTPARPGGADTQPAFSPDGRRIVFVSDRDGNPELYALDSQGGANVVRLTFDPAADMDPCWSPDGSRIAFTSARSGAAFRGLYVMPASGGRAVPVSLFVDAQGRSTPLDSGEISDPCFSPDGQRIAFAYRGDIYACRTDGTDLRRLTRGVGECSRPSWSPDGEAVAFTAKREDTYAVYLTRSDLGEQAESVRLTDRRANAGSADWR
jgi:TolB protein